MNLLRTKNQLSVASVLLLLLAAFAIDPPDHRCRTQSTRNRATRTVRLDDHDGDHNRWHDHGFDDSGKQYAEHPETLAIKPPGNSEFELVCEKPLSAPSRSISRARGRSPPVLS